VPAEAPPPQSPSEVLVTSVATGLVVSVANAIHIIGDGYCEIIYGRVAAGVEPADPVTGIAYHWSRVITVAVLERITPNTEEVHVPALTRIKWD
jgi:hypothetical protein